MKKIFFFLLIGILSNQIFAQELNCIISVSYSEITNANDQIFQSLQSDITEFMNMTKWTEYLFDYDERIECNIIITVREFNGIDRFTTTLQVTSSRPVYNTSYNTSVLNIKEDDGLFAFQYIENQPLVFNENSHTSNLTSVLAFYAYLIIAMDFDTFSEYGGTEFYQMMQKIVTNAQSSADRKGWTTFESTEQNNRYYVAEAFNNSNYKPFRSALYKYHRLGLDIMSEDIIEGRKSISESIENLLLVYKKKRDLHLLTMFFDAKVDEIVNIYSEANTSEIQEVYDILKIIDIANSSDYETMGKDNDN
jgi:predicted CopG family antitoxin